MNKLIRPLFYKWRGKSDRPWIVEKIRAIPESRRREVSNHYETLFLRNKGGTGRKDANEYLNAIASEYRTEREVVEPKVKRSFVNKKPEEKYNSSDGLWKSKIN